MIVVEHLADGGDLEVVGRLEMPRQVEDPVEVGADDGVLGRADLHVAQALELLLRDLLGLLRKAGLRDAILETVEIPLIAVVLAELFLDGLELLAEDVLALVLAHLLFDLGVDAVAHLQDLELAGQQAQHLADALLDVHRLEQRRFLVHGSVEVRRDQVREGAGGLNRIDERPGFPRELGHELNHLLRDVPEAHRERLGLVIRHRRLLEALDLGLEVRRSLRHVRELDSRQPLKDERVIA